MIPKDHYLMTDDHASNEQERPKNCQEQPGYTILTKIIFGDKIGLECGIHPDGVQRKVSCAGHASQKSSLCHIASRSILIGFFLYFSKWHSLKIK